METQDALIPGLRCSAWRLLLHPLVSCVSRSWRYALKLPLLCDFRTCLGLQEHHVFIWAPAKLGPLSRKCTQFYLIDPLLLECHPLPPHPSWLPSLRWVARSPSHAYVEAVGGSLHKRSSALMLFRGAPSTHARGLHQPLWMELCMLPAVPLGANLKSVERFDLISKKWERIVDMKEKRYMAAGIALQRSFCVLRGCQLTQEGAYIMHDSAEIWDPLKEEWQLIPHMCPNSMCKVAVVKGKLYILSWHTKAVMWFDEKSNQWPWLGGLTC